MWSSLNPLNNAWHQVEYNHSEEINRKKKSLIFFILSNHSIYTWKLRITLTHVTSFDNSFYYSIVLSEKLVKHTILYQNKSSWYLNPSLLQSKRPFLMSKFSIWRHLWQLLFTFQQEVIVADCCIQELGNKAENYMQRHLIFECQTLSKEHRPVVCRGKMYICYNEFTAHPRTYLCVIYFSPFYYNRPWESLNMSTLMH